MRAFEVNISVSLVGLTLKNNYDWYTPGKSARRLGKKDFDMLDEGSHHSDYPRP